MMKSCLRLDSQLDRSASLTLPQSVVYAAAYSLCVCVCVCVQGGMSSRRGEEEEDDMEESGLHDGNPSIYG